MDWKEQYKKWLAFAEGAVKEELLKMDEAEIKEAFYRDLAFGTGGLRGIIGAGTNRINVYVVARASQGLANYLRKHFGAASVAIGYDSRIKSDLFARTAACVFAANGIDVHFWPQLTPVPTVSFAVRHLNCSAGVMITASHNPSNYNGYKVYGADGCQITTDAAAEILQEIDSLDVFGDVCASDFGAEIKNGRIRYIGDDVMTAYIEAVKGQSVLYGDRIDRHVAIVYSPLNGSGLLPITRALSESGFTNITVVPEQKEPDGNFPTCPYPNPESREAMQLGLQYCRKTGADLLLATDPDCDRCGIAVKTADGDYRLLSGNEVGLLLLDYICAQRAAHGKLPKHPVFIKTIVTTDLSEKIAAHYGAETINVLTGFKFIGEAIGRLESKGEADRYILGFEESYGYLTGTYVRDKDGVNAALMICEMFAFYKTHQISLSEKLEALYNQFGFCLNTLRSYQFAGMAGAEKMRAIMAEFRKGISSIGGLRVIKSEDYSIGLYQLPKSDVLKFYFESETESGSVVIRPSGTEPKLKAYISVTAKDRACAQAVEAAIAADLEKRFAS